MNAHWYAKYCEKLFSTLTYTQKHDQCIETNFFLAKEH